MAAAAASTHGVDMPLSKGTAAIFVRQFAIVFLQYHGFIFDAHIVGWGVALSSSAIVKIDQEAAIHS